MYDSCDLAKQVEQLHLRLQQEKSMRMVLEKAMGRASSSLSPGHRHFAGQVKLQDLCILLSLNRV